MPMRRVAMYLFLAALAMPALAQQAPTFTPNPAPQGANVRMAFVVSFGAYCGQELQGTSTTRTGNAIRVDYVIGAPPGTICIGTPPPGALPVAVELGGFPPGQYTVDAIGFDRDSAIALPTISGGFGVFAASNVPTLSAIARMLLVLAALVAGVARMPRRTPAQ